MGRHTGTKRPLDEDHVSKTFKKYVRVAACRTPSASTDCGTQLLRKDMDLHEVAQWLGHSSLDSVRTYEHPNDQDLRAKMDKLGL